MNCAIKDLTSIKNQTSQNLIKVTPCIETAEQITTQTKPSVFSTWKRVTIGDLGDAKTARRRLEDSCIKISRWGSNILNRIEFKETKTSLDLVRISAKNLGLRDRATMAEIYDAAKNYGLSLCPAEVAPQLWLQHPVLLLCSEWMLMAMDPIVNSSGGRDIFRLEHSVSGRWLSTDFGNPAYKWYENHRWIFSLGKS